METHSSILAWRIPWREESVGTAHGVTKSWTQLSDKHFHFFMSKEKCIEDRPKGIIIVSVLTT